MSADAGASADGPAGYGVMGSLRANPGRRAELIEVLATGSTALPGCSSYVIGEDLSDPDVIQLSEVWDSKAAYDARYDQPQVQAAMVRVRTLMAGIGDTIEMRIVAVLGGHS